MPDYEIGDRATQDVVTPLQLIVFDPEATEKLRQQEAARVQAIFRFYPGAVDDSEASLRSTFAATREKFLASLEATFKRRQLGSTAVTNARFARLVGSFQRQNKSFPLTTNLAQIWAMGEEDESVVAPLASRLRETMGRTIRADALPAEGKLGPPRVLMVSMIAGDGRLDLETAQKRGAPFFKTNIHQLWKVRKELQSSFPAEAQAAGKFLAGFIKPNCVFDNELTRQSRGQRTEPIWAADQYEPGQSIVTNGQVIDAKARAALDRLKAARAVDEAKAQAEAAQLAAQTSAEQLREQATRAQAKTEQIRQWNQWLLFGSIFLAAAFGLVVWGRVRAKTSANMLPARIIHESTKGDGDMASPQSTETILVPLTQRAFLEQRAGQAGAIIGKVLTPQFVRWLMTRAVRSLIAQRTQLAGVQQAAELAVAELEGRLASMNAPLEDRLRAYEGRIAELERELAAKVQENEELIRAQIDLTRRKLESARSKGAPTWN